ncbi:uncharacterized protein LOC128732605 [Sabethes cyaneus]|uniref:uncharacterized protein LOC128732605 n=1 Tax=Sabethes cyaneus TaxID=53552 RepID=UPI00237E8AF9|nr:uncharacterized protein LOC128732605 [Sabethes cyaneus]
MKRINIIHLAPNLRRLYVKHICRDLPMVIPKLTKLEHLQADFLVGYIDLFQKCTEVTKLTSVDLCLGHIDEKNLKQLCKFCPLLTKLRINVDSSTSLRCLASLIHLKVLSVYALDTTLFANNDVCLPNVEIFQFNIRRNLHFDRSVQRMFPNVHYIKFGYGWKSTIITGKISASFPHLRTLEITHIRGTTDLVDRLVGLSKLRELIAHEAVLSDIHLPPMNLPQLTLKHSEFEVTDEMAQNFPNLRFLNLYGKSRCINAEKLPPTCTVRRFHRGCVDDVFDIKL